MPIKSRHTGNIIAAWEATFKILKHHGEAHKIHILDNECSNDMKDTFIDAGVKYQLVPLHMHIRNTAERSIRTVKTTSSQIYVYGKKGTQDGNGIV